MNYKNAYLFLVAMLLLWASCSPKSSSLNIELMDKSSLLIEEFPDSALIFLDSVRPKTLSRPLYNKYQLLYVQARDKAGKSIVDDTIMFQVKDYYMQEGDAANAAMASFYCGRIQTYREEYPKAMQMYTEAEAYAEKTVDYNLKGLIAYDIGDLYRQQLLRDDALGKFRKAVLNFNKAGRYKSEVSAYNRIGVSFLEQNEADSAFYYFEKGLLLAKAHNDAQEQGYILQNMGLAYGVNKETAKGRGYLRESLTYFDIVKSQEDITKVYLGIAYLFNLENNKDSTVFYLESLKGMAGVEKITLPIYSMYSDLEERDGNYKEALKYQKEYTKKAKIEFQSRSQQEILDIKKKYDFEKIENENNQLLIQRQTSLLVALLLLLAVLVIAFLSYRRLQQDRKALRTAQGRIYQLNEMAESFDKEKSSVRNILLQHFNVLKKVALLDSNLREEEKKQGQKLLKKVNEIVYDQDGFDWEKGYDTLRHIYNGFPDKLRKLYPDLDDVEFKICNLAYAGLGNPDIAIIMGLSINTIQSKKRFIRKKMGIEGYGNMEDFLADKVRELA